MPEPEVLSTDYAEIEAQLKSRSVMPFHPTQSPLGSVIEARNVVAEPGEKLVLIRLEREVNISEYLPEGPATPSLLPSDNIVVPRFCEHCGASGGTRHRADCDRPGIAKARRVTRFHYSVGAYKVPLRLLTFPWLAGPLRDWSIHPALTAANIEIIADPPTPEPEILAPQQFEPQRKPRGRPVSAHNIRTHAVPRAGA
jgi:hypothetical protein